MARGRQRRKLGDTADGITQRARHPTRYRRLTMFYSYEAFRLMHEDFVTNPLTDRHGRVGPSGTVRIPAGPTSRLGRRRRR
jgi:hypothetical protein